MIKIPLCILILIGYLGNIFRLLGINSNFSSSNMRALCINNYYSNKKSLSALHLKYQSTEKAIQDAIEYFKKTVK